MEQDKKRHILKRQRTRKLNCPFAVKLSLEDLNTGVPFSWDRIPGQPQPDYTETYNTGNTYQTPPTPPPSSRWQPLATERGSRADIQLANPLPNLVVDGFGGNEAIDIFSLAETAEGFAENCNTCSTEPDDANQSPDFIIQRFLPDAQALAAASLAQKKLLFSSPPSSDASFSQPAGVRCVKGCGFCSLYISLMKPKSRTPPGASNSDSTSHSTNKQNNF